MKKRKIALYTVIVIVVLFLAGTMTIEGIVKRNLENELGTLMGTEVRIGDVDFSLISGSGRIQKLEIYNPAGFSEQVAIYIGEASMDLDLSTLISDEIYIRRMEFIDTKILVEQEGARVNLRTLNDQMNSELSQESESEQRMIIEQLLIQAGSLTLITNLDKQRTTEVGISQMEINGIGKANSGTIRQSFVQVMEPLINKALTEALKDGVMEQLHNTANELLGD